MLAWVDPANQMLPNLCVALAAAGAPERVLEFASFNEERTSRASFINIINPCRQKDTRKCWKARANKYQSRTSELLSQWAAIANCKNSKCWEDIFSKCAVRIDDDWELPKCCSKLHAQEKEHCIGTYKNSKQCWRARAKEFVARAVGVAGNLDALSTCAKADERYRPKWHDRLLDNQVCLPSAPSPPSRCASVDIPVNDEYDEDGIEQTADAPGVHESDDEYCVCDDLNSYENADLLGLTNQWCDQSWFFGFPPGSVWGHGCEPQMHLYENECVDNPEWEDSLGDGCDWYAENDPGCSVWMDLGQLEHCPVACKSGCAQEGE